MRALRVSGTTPREWGRAHGETFRCEIESITALRMWLVRRYGFASDAAVLALAQRHLPILESFDRDGFDELGGIAEGAALSPAHIVVLNHYTDLRDLDPRTASDEGCSVIYAADAGVLAQTWDMHATAIPYVMLLGVPARAAAPAAWLFSITGCLGMAGLNEAGVAVAINNLYSTDARIGLVWPALVRRALRERTAAEARDVILSAPLGSGHHYMVADPESAFAIETSGQLREVIYRGERPGFVHTNHCLDPAVAARSKVPDTSTTYDRLAVLERDLAARPIADVRDAWRRLGSTEGYPRSVCTNMATPENPHGTATCGAIAFDLRRRLVLAASGLVHNVEPEEFRLP